MCHDSVLGHGSLVLQDLVDAVGHFSDQRVSGGVPVCHSEELPVEIVESAQGPLALSPWGIKNHLEK